MTISAPTRTYWRAPKCARLLGVGAMIFAGVAWSAPDPPLKDVSDQLSVRSSGFRLDRSTGELVQAVTLTNTGSQGVKGNLYMALDGLDPGVLVRGEGRTITLKGVGPDSIALAVPRTTLKPGEKATTVLRFKSNGSKPIRYQPRILQQTTNK